MLGKSSTTEPHQLQNYKIKFVNKHKTGRKTYLCK